MNKKFYLIGLPACFIILAAGTYLVPKTYESKFVIVQETDEAIENKQIITLNNNQNYDLGMMRLDDEAYDMYAYREIIKSDQFIRPLLDTRVRTIDGQFDGRYYDYLLHYCKKPLLSKITNALLPKPKGVLDSGSADDVPIRWANKEQEDVKNTLLAAIDIEVDYETDFVTVTCTTQDPLVSTMVAEAINQSLLDYVETQQLNKMQRTYDQLAILTANAKADFEQDKTAEKCAIYESFKKQLIIYRAQMIKSPAFNTLAEPTFSYKKAGPSRWKIPMLLTILLGASMLCWDNRKKIKKYILG